MRTARRSDSVMTIDDLSAYLKVSKSTLYKLAQEGKVPGQKVGRHWRFHKDVVDEWLGKSNSSAPRKVRGRKPR
jgi:excisionase family DNA binding protein